MAVVSMKQFLEAGAHFGHQTRRWNPRMRPYIYGSTNGVHIIDLQQTMAQLQRAYHFVRTLSTEGGEVLFVGTKLQAREIVREEATRCGGYYINERWLGGLMTNFTTIKQSVAKLQKLEQLLEDEEAHAGLLKKELLRLEKQRVKLLSTLGGIREMRRLPDAIFVVDCRKERIALEEANKLDIPVVAMVDTNCNPELVKYVIPGNDDAVRSIRLFTHVISSAVLSGKAVRDARLRSSGTVKRGGARASRAEQ